LSLQQPPKKSSQAATAVPAAKFAEAGARTRKWWPIFRERLQLIAAAVPPLLS